MIASTRPAIVFLPMLLVCVMSGAAHAQEAVPACDATASPALLALPPAASATGTQIVASPFGEVELPTAPVSALGMYTTDVDILIWLGYPLADRQPIRSSGYDTFPCFFPQEELRGITPFGSYPDYNYEQILLAEPDFILNGLGYDAAANERLPQIAPTYSVNAFDGRSWQDHFAETAKALGRFDRYEAWLAIYRNRLAEVRETIGANADAIVAPLSYWDGKFNTGCYAGVECTVFRDLGLTIFEGALKDDGKGVALSPESIDQLQDVDYVFTSTGIGEAGMKAHREQMAEATRNPLWNSLDFVRKDHVVPFEMEMVYGSPSGQLAFLEVVARALAD